MANNGGQGLYAADGSPTRNAGASTNSLRDAQHLLATYPFASATPSTHGQSSEYIPAMHRSGLTPQSRPVARHLSSLTITAMPPSYAQPAYYSTHGYSGHPSAYYANEVSQLAAPSMPQGGRERAYWDAARADSVRLLGDNHSASAASYYPPQATHWNPSPAPSTYQAPPFAQSLIQHTAPYNAYPTPPPPPTFSASSSSLAGALGTPPPAPERKHYPPTESKAFFNDFLAKASKEIKAEAHIVETIPPAETKPPVETRPITMPSTPKSNGRLLPQQPRNVDLRSPPSTPPAHISSPDPLGWGSQSPLTPLSATGMVTPQKRKLMEVVIQTPLKRSNNLDTSLLSPRTQNTSSTLTKSDVMQRMSEMQMFVEVTPPPKKWVTPSTLNASQGKSSDLGGYGTEDEEDYIRRRESVALANGVRSSGKRTGDRDDRAPLEKLTSLIEDIFEAEDTLSPDTHPSDLPSEFFSPLTTDVGQPLLAPSLIRKLTKYVAKVARPTKRVRLASWEVSGGTPRRSGGVGEVEPAILSRLLKILERSVKAGEDVEPFPTVPRHEAGDGGAANGASKGLKGKNSKKKGEDGQRSKSPSEKAENEDDRMDVDERPGAQLSDDDFSKLERTLEVARDSVLAADACIALLNSDRLTKQLYSEELITSCLATVKNQLTRLIYPFVEAPSTDVSNDVSFLLQHLTSRQSKSSQFDTSDHRRFVGETFQALSAVLPRINSLISAEVVSMSDSIIIQGVYIAIGPFFVVESGGDGEGKGKKDNASVIHSTLGSSAMRGLRLDALSLIRSIFANHEDQRSWIIEEILSSLIKLSDSKQKAGLFRLRDGRSIRTVSALLLQLVQTSAHNVRLEARRIAKARQQQFALRRQDSTNADVPESFLDDRDREEIQLFSGGLEAPTKAAKSIVLFLTQRSGKSKSTKNANEAEYRTIFDNLISDLLVVLFWPEWPAASLVLSIVCKFMITSLDDVKSATQADNNALKAISLDHLGVIAGRLRANMKKCGRAGSDPRSGQVNAILHTIDEALASTDEQQLDRLVNVHQEVSTHLCKRSTEDQAFESARELSAVMWGQELAGALNQCNSNTSAENDDDDEVSLKSRKGRKGVLSFGSKVKKAIREVWKDAPTDVFDNATQDEILRIDKLAEEIGTTQILKNAFDPILNVILVALDAPPVFMRTKALRALSQILTVDSSVLANPNVRHAIESHLLDSSPAVRDAAVELIGKYMIDSPGVAGDYYQKIAERIADTGLGVRKRVIKLLKSFYSVTTDVNRKMDICTKLVLRMLDEDDTVKDLAVKTLEELWFAPGGSASSTNKSHSDNAAHAEKLQLLTKVSVIMGVCGNFKDRQSPLEDMLNKIVSGKEGADVSALHSRYAEICDAMIDGLVDASDFMGFSVVNCIRTIHLFASAYPPIISGSKASTLLPYLKNPSTYEEQVTSDYILKIYRASIPHMPKTSAKFGNDLQLVLQPMVLKPSASAGLPALQETVACLCSVVQHLTHDFVRLSALLKSCNGRVQQYIDRPLSKPLVPQEFRALTMVVYILSLLGEHADFDRIRLENSEIAAELAAITTGSIVKHIYQNVLRLYEKFSDTGLRGRLLQCLGFLFRAQPTLMTLESSATMMDAIFASEEEESRGRLLKLMQEFLISESSKHSAQEKASKRKGTAGVNMEELVGNTLGFADSGVSSAVVQRYLTQIHEAALASNPQIQNAAVDILSFTIKQGLAHPLQSFPVIIALETSPSTALSARANALHSILHNKHSSLLNAGYVKAARASFDYQTKISSGQVEGYRMDPTPSAKLSRWYSLMREKRSTRQDFLKAIVKVFDVEDVSKTAQDDINFVRYMAENVSSLDYRTQEEVLTVIKYLTSVLSTTGMQLVETVSPSHLLAQLRAPSQSQSAPAALPADGAMSSPLSSPPKPDFTQKAFDERLGTMRSTVIIGMLMVLKAYLKELYSLSEEKCSKWVSGKKSAVGDRPATRRRTTPISWARMPFVSQPLLTSEDLDKQQSTFLDVWSEDGSKAEPDQDEWE